MSRTEGLAGLRSPADAAVAAAWVCVLSNVASDDSSRRFCGWAFLMPDRPLPVRVPCANADFTDRLLLLLLALVQISAARGSFSAGFFVGFPGAVRRLGVAAFATEKHCFTISSEWGELRASSELEIRLLRFL